MNNDTLAKVSFKSDIKQFTFIVCFLRTGLQWTCAGQSVWIACQFQPGHCGYVLASKTHNEPLHLGQDVISVRYKANYFHCVFSVFWISLDFPGRLNLFPSF